MNTYIPTARYIRLANEIYLRYSSIAHPYLRTHALGHTSMVDSFVTLLCLKRGVDVELGKIAALLHDIGKFELNAPSKSHAHAGAKRARIILEEDGSFTEDEIDAIVHAIDSHSNKTIVDTPLCEALKDADVLASWCAAPQIPPADDRVERLRVSLEELGMER